MSGWLYRMGANGLETYAPRTVASMVDGLGSMAGMNAQWGLVTIACSGGSGSADVAFESAFSEAPVALCCLASSEGTGCRCSAISVNGLLLTAYGEGDVSVRWLAIGEGPNAWPDVGDLWAAAEAAREAAERTRLASEKGRVENETERQTAETARIAAEQARESAETARGTAEGSRCEAELERAKDEAQRVAAERVRQEQEAQRQSVSLGLCIVDGALCIRFENQSGGDA